MESVLSMLVYNKAVQGEAGTAVCSLIALAALFLQH